MFCALPQWKRRRQLVRSFLISPLVAGPWIQNGRQWRMAAAARAQKAKWLVLILSGVLPARVRLHPLQAGRHRAGAQRIEVGSSSRSFAPLARCSWIRHWLNADYLASRGDVAGFLTTVATEEGMLINQASIFVRLVGRHQREVVAEGIVDRVRHRFITCPACASLTDLSTQGFTQQGFPTTSRCRDRIIYSQIKTEILDRMERQAGARH